MHRISSVKRSALPAADCRPRNLASARQQPHFSLARAYFRCAAGEYIYFFDF